MAKKPAPKKSDQREIDAFAERYDMLATVYSDPVEFMFAVMADETHDIEVRLSAAKTLTEFRYPKLKAVENKSAAPSQPVQLNIIMQAPPTVELPAPVLELNPRKES